MLFTRILVVSTLALLANTQTPTTTESIMTLVPLHPPAPTLAAAAYVPTPPAALEKYLASLTKQPEFTSAVHAYTSAMPAEVVRWVEQNPDAWMRYIRAGGKPSWVSNMPTRYIQYFSSVEVAERSIINKAAEGPAPTNGPQVKVIGAALAVGAAGLALL